MSPNISEKNFTGLKIIVAGDCMLDAYVHGQVSRISPEGPFPVLSITHETQGLGGAGNVFANLKGLGVAAKIIGVTGDDAAAGNIAALCGEGGVFLKAADRPTIQKRRFVGNGSQMLRADVEKIAPLSPSDEDKFINLIVQDLKDAAALILSDYGKGALTKAVLQAVIAAARERQIPVLVDPKGRDYTIYKGASVVTPNRKELSEASGQPVADDKDIEAAMLRVLEISGIMAMVATRSEDGMSVLTAAGGKVTHLKTEARQVSDVSGAGDTVIATLAAGLAAGLDLIEAAMLANRAAGIVVGKAGAVAIQADELFARVNDKAWVECTQGKTLVEGWKAQGLKVGFTNGCFDILHAGHVTYLAEARKYCDRLVLALNHDNSVRILKGPTRPVNDEESRAVVMAALSSVDCVMLFGAEKPGEDNTPVKLLSYLEPDIYFKGGDYREDQLAEAKIVRGYGGDVKLMGIVEGKSTTNIIKKISAA